MFGGGGGGFGGSPSFGGQQQQNTGMCYQKIFLIEAIREIKSSFACIFVHFHALTICLLGNFKCFFVVF